MTIDTQTVTRIAHLARIRLNEDDKAPLAKELSGILDRINQLNEVDITGIEPLTSVVEARLPLREDIVNDGNNAEGILANAPQEAAGFFVVPKVVE